MGLSAFPRFRVFSFVPIFYADRLNSLPYAIDRKCAGSVGAWSRLTPLGSRLENNQNVLQDLWCGGSRRHDRLSVAARRVVDFAGQCELAARVD